MSIYSKALRHVDSKDFRKTHQRRLDDQKVLRKIERDQKLQEKKEAEEIKKLATPLKYDWRSDIFPQEEEPKQIEVVEEIKVKVPEKLKSNWRKDLLESMTTTSVFFTNLSVTGDVDLVNTDTTFLSMFNSLNADTIIGDGDIYSEVVLSGTENSIVGGEHTIYRRAMFKVDARTSSTLKLTIQKGGGTSNWTDRGQSWNDAVVVNIYSYSDPFGASSYYNENLPSGTHLINLPGQFSDLIIQIEQFAKVAETGSLSITNASLQRRTPLNVLIPLDSPEASAFIRTSPILSNLSPQERLEKLKVMLQASDQYVMKMLGSNFPGTGAVLPGQYDPFAQSPPGTLGSTPGVQVTNYQSPTQTWDPKSAFTIAPDSPGVEIAGLPPGMFFIDPTSPNKGPSGYKAPGTYDPRQFLPISPNYGPQFPQPDLPQTGPGLSQTSQDIQIASNNKKQPMVASYEPQGNLISEKKKLKSPEEILNRIPGYYDGKPAPLGFPETPPPKMVNGMHPDLVDGKNVANRFNRLDPESAKATPLTGNPHIDKKILKARKQSK